MLKTASKWLCIASSLGLAISAQASQYQLHDYVKESALAAAYMTNVQRRSGLFSYEYDFITDSWKRGDNVVRQAGAGYGLGEYLVVYPDPIAESTLKKALDAYVKHSIVYEDGALMTFDSDINKASTGATSLAIGAAVQYRQATGDDSFDADIKAWVKGLLSLRKTDGFFPYSATRNSSAPYFDGESWLTLAMYADQFPNDQIVISVLTELDQLFVDHYQAAPHIGFFHWGLMASAMRFEQTKNEAIREFAEQQIAHYLAEMRPGFNTDVNSCYAIEGMAAVWPMIADKPSNEALAHRLRTRIDQEMHKNINMQVQVGQTEWSLGSDRSLYNQRLQKYVGGFMNGRDRPSMRIDFTQHCLSAMIKASQM